MIEPKDHITSTKNARIQNLVRLDKPRARKEQGVFIIEGRKEIEKAFAAGYQMITVFFCPDLITLREVEKYTGQPGEVFSVSREVFAKISYRDESGGMVVISKPKDHCLQNIHLQENPLIIVLESVEKPGNLGAILRTADAAGVDALVVCDTQTDLYNPNVIRSGLGCLFTVPVATGTSEEVIAWLKEKQVSIFCTELNASLPYHTVDFRPPAAIVLGTESTGLTQKWLHVSDQNIIIPMSGMADSLNVSVSAAIVVFEAKRQRGFGTTVSSSRP